VAVMAAAATAETLGAVVAIVNFHYKRGRIETSVPWTRPKWSQIRNYLNFIAATDLLKRYTIYIRGGVLYDIDDTWDLDLNLVGDHTDEQLEHDLNFMTDSALNHFNLLVDLKWVPKIFEPFTYANIQDPNYTIDIFEAKIIADVFKTVNDVTQRLDKPGREDRQRLGEHLMLIHNKYIHKDKFLDCVRRNRDLVVCQHMNVQDFLAMSEENFFQQTNIYKEMK
jgi:hypothetical protein